MLRKKKMLKCSGCNREQEQHKIQGCCSCGGSWAEELEDYSWMKKK